MTDLSGHVLRIVANGVLTVMFPSGRFSVVQKGVFGMNRSIAKGLFYGLTAVLVL